MSNLLVNQKFIHEDQTDLTSEKLQDECVLSSITYHILIPGKTNLSWTIAKKKVAENWGFKIKYWDGGCNPERSLKLAEACKVKNKRTYRCLKHHFGKDWKEKFNKEVREEMEKNK